MEPALGPSRPGLKGSPVERDRLVRPVRGARGLGPCRETRRVGGGGLVPRGRGREDDEAQGHQGRGERLTHDEKHALAAEAAHGAPPPLPHQKLNLP